KTAPEMWSLSFFLISISLLPTVTSTACPAVPAPIAGFTYAQQYIRGNYSDAVNGTDHALGTASPGTDWRQEYSLGYGAFQSNTANCAADCVYRLQAYTKPEIRNSDCDWDYRTIMMRMDPATGAAYDPAGDYTAYKTQLSTTTSTLYCARQEGYCGATTPLYLYYNKNTSDYVTRGATQPNGTEEDPNSVIANGGQPWCYLFQPPTTTSTTVSTTTATTTTAKPTTTSSSATTSTSPTITTTTIKSSTTSSSSSTTSSSISSATSSSASSPSTTTTPTTTTTASSTTGNPSSTTTTNPSSTSTVSSQTTSTTSYSGTLTSASGSSSTTTRTTTTTAITTTRTPATTTTVSTTTSPYVYPGTTDTSGTYEPGDTVFPNGTIVRTNGDTVYPNGTVLTSDGWTIKDGTKIAPNGTVYNPNGSQTYPNGTTLNADGSTTYPNGTTVTKDGTAYNPGGTVSYPNGTVAYPNGTTTYPDGSYQAPNGVTYYPNGTQKYEDGTVVSADGTVTSPDGTVTYPNGTTVVAPPATAKSGSGISLGWPLIILGVIVGAGLVIGVIYCLTIQFIKSGARAVSPEYYHRYEPYRSDTDMAPPRVMQPAAAAPPPFS
ncbi:cwp-4, partial [Pristionchus pacificus]